MKFEKGNKYGTGRKKGSVNKSTLEIKEAFKDLLSANMEKLQNDIDAMKGVERFNAMMQLTRYILPTLRASSVEIETDKKEFDIPLITFYKTPEDDD